MQLEIKWGISAATRNPTVTTFYMNSYTTYYNHKPSDSKAVSESLRVMGSAVAGAKFIMCVSSCSSIPDRAIPSMYG
jgi:hypothetical protein